MLLLVLLGCRVSSINACYFYVEVYSRRASHSMFAFQGHLPVILCMATTVKPWPVHQTLTSCLYVNTCVCISSVWSRHKMFECSQKFPICYTTTANKQVKPHTCAANTYSDTFMISQYVWPARGLMLLFTEQKHAMLIQSQQHRKQEARYRPDILCVAFQGGNNSLGAHV